jgi:cytochrome c553
MKFISLFFTGLLSASLVSPAVAGDVIAGATVAQACIMCHGQNGITTLPGIPSLAGQSEIYLASQIKQFRDGKRHNETMNVIAKPLSDTDIENVSSWFAQFEITLKNP